MARPIWTGSINFGLVNIPVQMVTVVHEKAVHFHMLTKDGTCRLRRKLVCPQTGKEYDFNQTARGIEIGPEDYVLVDQKEIDRLKPEKGRTLEIVQFFKVSAIDPIYYDNVYFLQPGKDAEKVYKLLVEAMKAAGKCALGRFVMREREYLAVLRVVEDGMALHTLHYADEVDEMEFQGGKAAKVSAAELNMAQELIKSMTRDVHLDEFKDDFRDQLKALIDAKVKGKEIERAPEEDERPVPKTINLMDALRRSLSGSGDGHNGHSGRGSHNGHDAQKNQDIRGTRTAVKAGNGRKMQPRHARRR